MAILRSIPKRGRHPTYSGRIMIDACRGVLRVRKWPKKRGPPRSAKQAWWVDWFVQANKLAKYVDGMSAARAIAMTKGSGLYPRDVLLMAMAGRLYTWSTPDGWRWYSMAAIGDVSETLDVLAQTIGSVLVRASDRWRSPPPGQLGYVLTHKGPGQSPVWQAAGGGVSPSVVPPTPITADGTVNNYVIDVSAYAQVTLMLDAITFGVADRLDFVFSLDGGSTFKTGASDYTQLIMFASSTSSDLRGLLSLFPSNWTSGIYGVATFNNLRAGRAAIEGSGGKLATANMVSHGFANFDGPVTHIKVFSRAANNLSGGTIRAVGF